MDTEHTRQGHSVDPIQNALVQGPAFDSAWLKSDRKLSNTQRLGFIAFSTMSGMIGAVFLRTTLMFLDGDIFSVLEAVLMGAVAGFFLYLGLKGMWRVAKDVFKSA